MVESKRKSDLFAEIENLKEENINFRISQEKLNCANERAADEAKASSQRLKNSQKQIHDLEDKIDRLVDALRKAKELADSRQSSNKTLIL